jgi:hypothetical protein
MCISIIDQEIVKYITFNVFNIDITVLLIYMKNLFSIYFFINIFSNL